MAGRAAWAPEVLRRAGEDDGEFAYTIAVSETEDDESWSLLLMVPGYGEDAPDDDDETYCLVVGPAQGGTTYGGVRECDLTPDRLRLVLTPETAADLGVPAELRFGLELSPGQFALLRAGLRRVLSFGDPQEVPLRLAL